MNKLEDARIKINEIDEQMATLFVQRMAASKLVAEYKQENNLPIFDKKREEEIILKNKKLINNEELVEYYVKYIQSLMDISKEYQQDLLRKNK